jgi:undecaprenyl-diphosphatase
MFLSQIILAAQHAFERMDDTLAAFFRSSDTSPFFFSWDCLSNIGHGRCVGIILGTLLIILALKKRWYDCLAVLLTVPGMYLGELVKIIVHRTRPDPLSENGFSFPSGHAITATLAYGLILVLVLPLLKTRRERVLATTFTIFLVCGIGFARVALGAHYASDIAASIIFGSAWLVLCVKFTRSLERRYGPGIPAVTLPKPKPRATPVPEPVPVTRDLISQ